MQVQPIAGLDDAVNEIRLMTAKIVSEDIIPSEGVLYKGGEEGKARRQAISAKVKDPGLWAPHLPEEYGGMGIGFLKHAYMNEILAWSPFSARLFRCRRTQFRQSENPAQIRHAGTKEEVAGAACRRRD